MSNIATEAAESTTQPSDVLNTDLTELLDFSAADNELNLDDEDQSVPTDIGQVGEQSNAAANFDEMSFEQALLSIEPDTPDVI